MERIETVAAFRRHRYTVLMVLLLVSIAIQSFDTRHGAAGLLSDAFRTVVTVVIFVVVFERRRERALMAMVLVAILAIAWGATLRPQPLPTRRCSCFRC